SLAAFSLSPVLLLHGTQPLKDDMFAAVLTAMCIVLALAVTELLRNRLSWIHAGVGPAATYVAAGIRAYMPVIICATLACTLIAFCWHCRLRLHAFILRSGLLLGIVWTAYALGAGPYYIGPTLPRFGGPLAPIADKV